MTQKEPTLLGGGNKSTKDLESVVERGVLTNRKRKYKKTYFSRSSIRKKKHGRKEEKGTKPKLFTSKANFQGGKETLREKLNDPLVKRGKHTAQ